ncbi:MAG: cytochrome c [Acidimicrobiia bacterium]
MVLKRLVLLSLAAVFLLAACAPQVTPVESDSDPVISLGGELYQANCQACHGGATGGSVTDIPPPHNADGHTWHHSDCLLTEIILEGSPPRPGLPEGVGPMPSFEGQLTVDEVAAILTYIKTWWTEEQREFQAEITDRLCQ